MILLEPPNFKEAYIVKLPDDMAGEQYATLSTSFHGLGAPLDRAKPFGTRKLALDFTKLLHTLMGINRCQIVKVYTDQEV